MLGNWQDWCRFCSNTDAESVCKMDTMDELENVNKYFNLSLPPLDGIQLSVCHECCNFLTKFDGFRDRCLKADQMFKDLMHRKNLSEGDLQAIRIEYGLDEEMSFDQSVSESRFNTLAIKGEIEIEETVIMKTEKPEVIPLPFLQKKKPNGSVPEYLPAKKKKRMGKEIRETENLRMESPEVVPVLLPEKEKPNKSLPKSLPAKTKKRMDKNIRETRETENVRMESPKVVLHPLPEKEKPSKSLPKSLPAKTKKRMDKEIRETRETENVRMESPKVVLHPLPEKEKPSKSRSKISDTRRSSRIATLPQNLSKSPPESLPDAKKKKRNESLLARDLREYFRAQRKIKVNGADLLRKKTLNILNRRKVINIVARHMLMRLPSPKKSEKIAYAKATIELFPCLKIDSDLGYDAVYRPINRGGYLGNVIKTIRAKMRKENKIFAYDPDKIYDMDEEEADPLPKKDMAMERVKDQLKTTPALRTNIKKIFDGMDKTFGYRRKFIHSSLNINILLEYPRFGDTYGLIQRDFEKSYPEQHQNLKNLYKKEFQELLHHLGNEKLDTLASKDWELPEIAALCWLSLLPPTCSGEGIKDHPKLNTAFECLLKYQYGTVEPPFKPTPTIVVQVNARNEKKKYFVAFNGKSIPTNDTFVDALDILFKIHFVFNLEFELALRNFLLYLEYYVFGIRDKHSTNITVNKCRMILISNDNGDSGKNPLISWV